MAKPLPVIEIFGPTIQGEGPMIGVQTVFVRLGYCDYRCSWCDTKYAVESEQVRANARMLLPEDIVEEVQRIGPTTRWVTLSGGNPVIHDLESLVSQLKLRGYQVALETQGSVFRSWVGLCDTVVISPKPPSSGMKVDFSALDKWLQLVPRSHLKVVVFDDADFEFAVRVRRRYPYADMYLQVGNDVGNDSTKDLLRKLDWLIDRVKGEMTLMDVRILPQLHVLLWGNRRGV